MQRIFNLDSPILRFLATAFDFFILNVVTLLLCIPVFTAGAAFTALYRVVLSYLDHSNESLSAGRLIQEWLKYLKKATLPWISLLAVFTILLLDIRIIGYMPDPLRAIMVTGAILVMNILLLAGLFFFPLLSQAPHCKFRKLLHRSVLCSLGLLPRMILIAILWLLPGALLIFFPKVFVTLSFLWIGGWMSICVLISGKLLMPYLQSPDSGKG